MLHPQREILAILSPLHNLKRGVYYLKLVKDSESGDESDDNSIMPPLLRKEDMDAMDSGYESDHEPVSSEML